MTRLTESLAPTDTAADAEREALLAEVESQLGRVPNLYRAMAEAPAALRGYLAMRGALLTGRLGARQRELIALLVAQENDCDYCIAAHTFRGERMGISAADLLAARRAESPDVRTAAILRLARAVVRARGAVGDDAVAAAREQGVSDAEMAEVVAHVALNSLSNYFSRLAEPELDFPPAPSRDGGSAAGGAMGAGDGWRSGAVVELVDGYTVSDADGRQVGTVGDVRVRFVGGFAELEIAGVPEIQVVSAPAVRRISVERR